jgi:RNA polymerase II subunit A C-terminal domain phosphatase
MTSTSPAENGESLELSKTAMLTRNSIALSAQLEERPLAKKQEELQEASEDKPNDRSSDAAFKKDEGSPETEGTNTDAQRTEKPVRKALLKNDDTELERVSKVCPLCSL